MLGAFLGFFTTLGVYRTTAQSSFYRQAYLAGKGYVYSVAVILSVLFLVYGVDISRALLVSFFTGYPFLYLTIWFFTRLVLRLVRKRGYGSWNTLAIGSNPYLESLLNRLGKFPDLGYDVVSIITTPFSDNGDRRLHVERSTVERVVQEKGIELITFSTSQLNGSYEELEELCRRERVGMRVISPEADFLFSKAGLHDIAGISIYTPVRRKMDFIKRTVKRAFDIVVSLLSILIMAPVFLSVALATKLESRGPVFFKQRRSLADNDEPFDFIKFRSMYHGADEQKETLFHHNEATAPCSKCARIPVSPKWDGLSAATASMNSRSCLPFPDTAFDFANSYRFGMPFFIPVVYDDSRWQLVENFTLLAANHTLKAGFEFNNTEAFQTFVGFGNARFIFSGTDGFLNYIANPDFLECSDGSTSDVGQCPAGTTATGPVIWYLQQTGLGGLSVEEAGTQTIEQKELALFVQDLWQPKPNLTFSYGLRWESQYQPDLITPRDELFYGPFIGQTVNGQEFPGDGTIPSDTDMWQPRLGVSWDPKGDGKTVIRANAGIYNARVPGLYLASARSTDGSRGGGIYRDSSLIDILGPTPPYDQLLDLGGTDTLFNPDVYVFDKNFKNPRTKSFAVSAEHQFYDRLAFVLKYNYADTDRLTRYLNANDPLLGANWSSGLGDDGSNGIGTLWTAESGAESEYWGVTAGVKGWIGTRINLQAYYTYGQDKSNDDNERDPFTLRYARITDLDAEWGYSDRDQRHRANLWFLWTAPKGWSLNFSYAYRSAQPLSLTEDGTPAADPSQRINADGTVTQRNLGRKDNEFSSFDFRVSKLFNLGKGLQIEAILDAFNLFNSTNVKKPQTTNLIFNFDGTITTGLGDPRQWQLGVRFIF